MLHPAPKGNLADRLGQHMNYLDNEIDNKNALVVLNKELQLLEQSKWPSEYESQISKHAKDLQIADSVILSRLINYFQAIDNRFLTRKYAKIASSYGFNTIDAFEALSKGYLMENQFDSALFYAKKAAELTDNRRTKILIANVALSSKDSATALDKLLIAHNEKELEGQDLMNLVDLLYARNEYNQAIKISHNALERSPQDSLLRIQVARLYVKEEYYAEGIAVLKQLPDHSVLRFRNLLNTYMKMGANDSIINETSHLITVEALKKEALLSRARAFNNKWFLKSAMWTYQQLLKLDPDHEVASEELEKVKLKAAYLRKIKAVDQNIDNSTL